MVVALVMSVGGWFLLSRQRAKLQAEIRKTDANTVATITGAAKTVIEKLEASVERLERKVEKLEQEDREKTTTIEAQEHRIDALEGEVKLVKRRMREVSDLNVELLKGSGLLSEQIRSFGEEPIWRRGE